MENKVIRIILFDGVCNLCNGWVNFVICRDRSMRFRFASLQSDAGRCCLERLGLDVSEIDTVVFIENDRYWLKSTAVLKIISRLGGLWRLFYLFLVVPVNWRDAVYSWVAERRYRWFGKRAQCMIPDKDVMNRFL